MFESFKAHFTSLWSINEPSKPDAHVADVTMPEEQPCKDFYRIELFTEGYHCDDEYIPDKYSCIKENRDMVTWMELVDKFADMLSHHYGYNIKEQIYYSVKFPINTLDNEGKEFPGYGRELNDEKLQLLLLTHPDLYSPTGFEGIEL
jgi:hypothetical protein